MLINLHETSNKKDLVYVDLYCLLFKKETTLVEQIPFLFNNAYKTKFIPLLLEAKEEMPIIVSEELFSVFLKKLFFIVTDSHYIKGIKYGELKEIFDLSKIIAIPKDLPNHAQVTFYNSKVEYLIEERTLLGMSMMSYCKAIIYQEYFEKKIKPNSDSLDISSQEFYSNTREAMSSYCISSILLIHNYLECFINSISFNNRLAKASNNDLHKLKDGNETIKKMFLLIGKFKNLELDWDNYKANKKELAESIETRNSIVHYDKDGGKQKKDVVVTADEWFGRAKRSIDICISESIHLWEDCYQKNEKPAYLSNLEINSMLKVFKHKAFKELEFSSELYEFLKPEYSNE